MEVSVLKLRTITDKLIFHLESLGLESITIEEDFYWNLPPEEKYDVLKDPDNIDIGQLTDDWEFLQKALEEDYYPIGYDFVLLARILEVIGEKGTL